MTTAPPPHVIPGASPGWSLPPPGVPLAWISTVLRVVAFAAAAVLLVWLLPSVMLLVFFAVLLGATLRGVADWLAVRTSLPPHAVLALVTLSLVGLLAVLVLSIGPSLVQQGGELVSSLSNEAQALQAHYGQTSWGQRIMQHLQPGSGDSPTAIATPAIKVLGVTLDVLTSLVLLVITALYLAISPQLYINGILRLVPIRHRGRGRQVMHQLGRTLRRWLLGQIIDMIAVAVLTSLGLSLLGVPVPLALGALAGVLTFIPYFGAILAGIPAVLVALSVSPHLALLTLGVFLVVHLVEGYLISPMIQRRLVDIPPALTVMAMTASGTLFGPLGVILGTPLAAAGMVAVRELYVVDVLGDQEMRVSQ